MSETVKKEVSEDVVVVIVRITDGVTFSTGIQALLQAAPHASSRPARPPNAPGHPREHWKGSLKGEGGQLATAAPLATLERDVSPDQHHHR